MEAAVAQRAAPAAAAAAASSSAAAASSSSAADTAARLKRSREADDDSDVGTARLSSASRCCSSSSSLGEVCADSKSQIGLEFDEVLQEDRAEQTSAAVQGARADGRSVDQRPARGSVAAAALSVPSQSAWATRLLTYSYANGLAKAGVSMVASRSEPKDMSHGVGMVSRAAAMGSDLAAYHLALWHDEGTHGLPHDASEAKYWYGKVAGAACFYKHPLAAEPAPHVAKAESRMREIDLEISAWAAAEDAAVQEALACL